ncbi:MAG: MATE family efflux transporter, partial [Clostridia bacterium]
ALDYLFLAAFHMGVEGAALATLLSQALATLLCLRGIRRVNDATPRKGEWRLHRATLRELLRLGLPPLLSFSVVSIGELVVQAAINLCGVVFVTGVTAARRYFSLLNIIGSALEGALATFVAQNTGARESQRILAGTRIAVLLGLGASVLTSVLVFVFAKPLILLFVPQGGAEIVRIGVEALRIETFFLWALYMLCLYRAAIQGMGNALIPMLSGFLELALRLVCVWLMPRLIGRSGLYFTDAFAWVLTAFMLIAAYLRMSKRLRADAQGERALPPKPSV